MLTLLQMEQYVVILDGVDRCRGILSQTGLSAKSYDSPTRNNAYQSDAEGEILIRLERAKRKMEELEALENRLRPEVEKTIAAAAALQIRGSIKTELALRMRYLHGWDWPEISERMHIKNPEQITAAALSRLERMEDDT